MERKAENRARVGRDGRRAVDARYQHLRVHVVAFFRRHLPGSQTAEDLTQEVFFRICKKPPAYRPGGPDLSYLYGFARMVLKEHLARCRLEPATDVDFPLDSLVDDTRPSPEDHAGTQEQIGILREFIADLPEKQGQAVTLVCLKGLTSLEAALRTGCSDATIRVCCHKALAKLQSRMKDIE